MDYFTFTQSTMAIVYIDSHDAGQDLAQWRGDYGYSYAQLLHRWENAENEWECQIKLAPLHLHLSMQTQFMEIPADKVQHMLPLKYEFDESFLAPSHLLFPNSDPALGKMVYVEQLRQLPDRSLIARVAPATLHLDGKYTQIIVKDDAFMMGLPLQIEPRNAHHCRQRQLLGVLDAFNQYDRI